MHERYRNGIPLSTPQGKKDENDLSAGETIDFGLSLNLDEIYDEFAERAKVLPFVRPAPKPKA